MKIKFLNQPKDVKIGEILVEKLSESTFSRVWLFAGFVKDSGLDYLLEGIQKARENGMIVECVLGVDKKNTSKDMLLKLLNLGCKIRFHINDDDSKLETRVYAFESDSEDSFVYLTGAKLSEGGLTENLAMITEIKYANNEKKEFNKIKLSIETGINNEKFESLTEERLKELASTGEILARITERKIPSISELYKSGDIETGIQEFDENKASKYNDLVNKDIEIDIDFSGSIDVKVQDSLGEEVEHKIKSKVSNTEATVVSKIVLNEKDADYDNMSTLIIPINKVVKKGVTAGEIKISSVISVNMNKFFNYPNDFHMLEDEKGKLREVEKVELEIFENMSKFDEKDNEASIIQTDKNTIIKSSKLAELDIADGDIMRLIKQADGKYRCEIIKQDSSEYNIWENFCVVSVKGTSKKFGVL
ncbi:MAG: hypothetical protein J6C46_02755 [Clostridia bacterium]|nr:hypothetical protein [Clostridia bacterium]